MTKRDVAIIGGTFDPVHIGHIEMAKYLSGNYLVDEIWMLPSYNSPHKDVDTKKTFEHRINMLKLATCDIKNVLVSNFEKEYYEAEKTDVKTYTIDILDALSAKFLNIYFHFVVGFDSIKQIPTWHNWQDLLKKYFIYVFDRKDNEFITKESKKMYIDNLGQKFSRHRVCELLDANITDISSTQLKLLLKNRSQNKDEILKYIPLNVYNYIDDNNLYM